MSYSLALLVLAGAFAGNVAAADLPYVGRWKANLTKSDIASMSVTFSKVEGFRAVHKDRGNV
jgi:hypothetical protein